MPLAVKDRLLQKIEQASESTLQQVWMFLLFIEFEKSQQQQLEISWLSEAILAEHWLTPEEDQAWEYL